MKTIHEVSSLAGVSIRTLQYYDKIGLLQPTGRNEAGYRLYGDADLERLQQILLFRELEFPLKDIRKILESSDFDRDKALEQQIALLTLKKEHIDHLLTFARGLKLLGVNYLADFAVFDMSKLDEYAAQAKASWENTAAYKEFQEKSKEWTQAEEQKLSGEFMLLIQEFGKIREQEPSSGQAQEMVSALQTFITEHFYTCTDKILLGLGKMYAGGGDFTKSIDEAGGMGTAEFMNRAIQKYCG